MRFWIIVVSTIVIFSVVGKIAYDLKAGGEAIEENKNLKIENKEIRNEAQSFANRPRTNDDIVDSLCAWGAAQLEREGKPKREIPVHCRR